MNEQEALYRELLKAINYVPAQGYVWSDGQNWHGPYATEEAAMEALINYLDLLELDD